MIRGDFQRSLEIFAKACFSSVCFITVFAISNVSSNDSSENENVIEQVISGTENVELIPDDKNRYFRKKQARVKRAASSVLNLTKEAKCVSPSKISSHIKKQNALMEKESKILINQLKKLSLQKRNLDFEAKFKKLKQDLELRLDEFEADLTKYYAETSSMISHRNALLEERIESLKEKFTQLNDQNLSKIIGESKSLDQIKNGEQEDYSEIGDLFEENDEWGLQDSSAAHDASSDEELGACIHPENALSEEEAFQNIIRIVSVAQKSSSKLTAILCRNALEAINSEYEDFKEATAKLNKERKILSISKALGSYNLVISKLDPVYGFKSLTYSDLVNHLAYNNRNVPKSEEVSISPEAASLKSEMNDFASRIRSSKDESDDELEEDVDDIEGAAGAANQVPRSVGEIKSPSTLFAFMKTQLKELADNYTAADKLLRANVINENIEKIENFEKKYDKAASTNDKARAILSAKKEYENIILSEYPDEKEKAKELRNEKSISHEIVLKVLNAVKQEGAQQTL